MTRRYFLALGIGACLIAAPVAKVTGPPQAGQASPAQGVVIKGKAPVSDEILKVKLPRPQEADLANGLHLMVLEDHRSPQVTMQVLVRGAGGYYDPADLPGLAGFTSAMMMEGTSTRSAQQIAQEQETMASSVSVSAGGSGENAAISASCLIENFDRTLALAADILLNPSFPEAELARYKTRQRASLVQVRMQPSFLAAERYGNVMYGDHPAGRVAPPAASVDKVTRDAIVAFHEAHYVPDQGIVAVVGDTTLAEARQRIETAFAAWKKAGTTVAPVKDPETLTGSKVYLVDRPNSRQTSLIVGAPGISRTSPDYDVVSLTNAVIGGGPTGRLFLNLREQKGWTYGAYSGLNTPRFRGDWQAQTEIRDDVTVAAIAEILNEIRRLGSEPVAEKEFADKKRSLVASFALSLETPAAILNNYITSRLYGLPADYWDRYPERIMAITREQVQGAAKKYLDPSRLQVVAVGDGKTLGEALKKFGTVVTYDIDGKQKSS